MQDNRTKLEKLLWNIIGEPLYYCEECLKYVEVKEKDGEVIINKFCGHTDARVMAPRKSMLTGKGIAGLSNLNKIKFSYQKMAAKLTGRNV